MNLDGIKTAAEAMFEAQTWQSLVDLVKAVLDVIFGFIKEEEDLA